MPSTSITGIAGKCPAVDYFSWFVIFRVMADDLLAIG